MADIALAVIDVQAGLFDHNAVLGGWFVAVRDARDAEFVGAGC